MPPHSIGSGTISFGLVSIPVKLYTAASSQGASFNMLHAPCGSRIKPSGRLLRAKGLGQIIFGDRINFFFKDRV